MTILCYDVLAVRSLVERLDIELCVDLFNSQRYDSWYDSRVSSFV